MITILDALERANKLAGINTELQFAALDEFQSYMNSFRFDQYPINVVVPITVVNQTIGPRRKTVLQLQGWMLTQIRGDHNNYRSKRVEREYTAPMRKLAMKFLSNLYQIQELMDPEVDVVSETIRPEYNFLNMSTFGVSYVANVPIRSVVCVSPDVDFTDCE